MIVLIQIVRFGVRKEEQGKGTIDPQFSGLIPVILIARHLRINAQSLIYKAVYIDRPRETYYGAPAD